MRLHRRGVDVAAIAIQAVVVAGAIQVLDRDVAVALGDAGIAGWVLQIGNQARR